MKLIKVSISDASLKSMIKVRRSELQQAKGAYEGAKRIKLSNPDIEAYIQPRNQSGKTWVFWFTPKMQTAELNVLNSDSEAKNYLKKVVEAYEAKTQRASARREESRKRKAEERSEFVNPLKPGDILSTSWGFDQTNVEFYKVLKVSKKQAKIVEVGRKYANSAMNKVVPDAGKIVGNPIVREVKKDGSVEINSVVTASPWDGKPEEVTDPYHTR